MIEDLRHSNEYIQIADAAMNAGIPTNIIDSPRTIKERHLISVEQIVEAYGKEIVFAQVSRENSEQALITCSKLNWDTKKECLTKAVGNFMFFWLND